MMGESFVERNTFGCLLESLVLSSNNIVKIFVNKDNPKDFIIFDGIYYYNVNSEDGVDAVIDGDSKSRVDYVKEKLEYAYKNKKANAKITSKNGRIIIDIDDYGSH